MSGFARMLTRINSRLSLIALLAAGLGLIAMTAIVAWTVFGRYVLNATPTWGEPASLFLMLWFILLGGSVGMLPEEARMLREVATGTREGLHFQRAKLVEALDKERAQRAIDGVREERVDSGIIHHDEANDAQITPARQRLLDFDERYPKILSELQAKGG